MAKEPSRTYSTPSVDTGASLPTAPKPKGKGKWKVTAVLFLVVLPLAAFALYVTVALNFSYASGERSGFVQKLSKKGWICKTQEGELALANGPNVMPEIFRFTVRDDSVAALISNQSGKQVKLTYEQHKGLPSSCFGETEYFVKGIDPIGAGAASAPPPATSPAATPTAATPTAAPSTAAPSTAPATPPTSTAPPAKP
jgi:hypothetical protein